MANKIKFQQIEGGDQLVIDAAQGLLDAAAALSAAQAAQSTADATDAAFVTFRDTTAPGLISTAKQQAIDAASADATTKANAAETAAKAYADVQDAANLLAAKAYTDAQLITAADDIGAFASADYVFASVDAGEVLSPSLIDVIINSDITIKEGEKGLIHFTDSAFSGLLASETPIYEKVVLIEGSLGKKVSLGGHIVVSYSQGVYDIVSIGASSYFQDVMAIRTLSMSQVSALDTRLTAAEGDIADAQTDIGNLNNRVTTAEGEIDTLQSDVTGLDTRLDTAEASISQHTASIININEQIQFVVNDLNTIQQTTDQHTIDIVALQNADVTMQGQISTLQTNVTTAQTTADTAVTNAATAQSAADAAQEDATSALSLIVTALDKAKVYVTSTSLEVSSGMQIIGSSTISLIVNAEFDGYIRNIIDYSWIFTENGVKISTESLTYTIDAENIIVEATTTNPISVGDYFEVSVLLQGY